VAVVPQPVASTAMPAFVGQKQDAFASCAEPYRQRLIVEQHTIDSAQGLDAGGIGISELNMSSATCHDPSDCLRQMVRYFPWSVVAPKVAVYVPVE
jgi:hypothetical protein